MSNPFIPATKMSNLMSKFAKNLYKRLRMTDFATRASRLVPPFCLCISHKSSRFAPRASQFLSNSLSYLKVCASRLAPYLYIVYEMKSLRFAPCTSHFPTTTDIHTKSSRLAPRTLRLQQQTKTISSRCATRDSHLQISITIKTHKFAPRDSHLLVSIRPL